MNKLRNLGIALIIACAAPLAPSTLFAQDDWQVDGGDERRREIVKRYKTLLERSPTEGLAFRKLLDYVGTGKGLEKLTAEYAKRVENNPENATLRLILGHLFKAANEYDKALAEYEKAVEIEPDNPVVWLSRGSVHVLLQRGEKATADFEKALELEKDRNKKQEILRKLADTAFAQRDWDRAQKYYDQLVNLDPRNEYLRMEYAQVLVQYKRYDKALEQYDKLYELAGGDTKARATTLRDMGDLYEKMGKDDEAIDTYERAMKLVRSSNWLHRELEQRIVGVYRRTDRLAELVAQYEKKWSRPNYDQAMLLGQLYDEMGQEDKALEMFETAVRRNRRATDPRLRVIRIKERRGDDKGVIKGYKELISIAPNEGRFYFDLVRLYFRLGDRKEAERLLDRIERRFRRDPDVHVMLADTYMRFDMQEEALDIYRKLVRMDPKNDAYILGLGEYYYQNGEVDDAVETWMKLLNSSLQEAEAHAKLGQVLSEHGLVEKGLHHFEKAVEAAPDDTNVRRGLALAYERARRWQQAIDAWNFILATADQPLSANEARTRIINIYQRQNKLRSKMREFAGKFSANPDDVHSGLFVAEGHVKLVEYDKAESVLAKIAERARTKDPEAVVPVVQAQAGNLSGATQAMTWKQAEMTALLALERLYQQNNNLEKGIAVLQRLAELMPGRSRDYYHRIADLSLKLYEDDQAVHYATLAVQMNPDDAMAQARLGDVYQKMGKLESAAAQYRQAIDLDPRAFEITMKLAEILLEIGQLAEAEELYRRIVKKANDENLILVASRRAVALAEVADRLAEVEEDFYGLVYKTPPKPVYRKVMLELYDRMSNPYVARDRYGVRSDRAGAAKQLDEIGQRALPVLIDALSSDEVGQRILAVRLLGDLRQPNAALPLSRMVDDPADPLRMPAAIAVAQIGDPRGSAPLIRVTEDSNPTMRELSTWALGAIGGTSAVDRLAVILREGQSWREQVMAAISLGRIGSKPAVDALLAYHETLSGARYSDSTSVAVVWALGRAGDPRSATVLGDALKSASDRVGTVAAWSLAQIGDEQATRLLLEAHWSETPSIQARAGRGLVQLASGKTNEGSTRRVDEIRREIKFINDRNPDVAVESMLQELERSASVVVPTDAVEFIESNASLIADVAREQMKTPVGRATVTSDLLDVDGDVALGVLTSTEPTTEERATRRRTAIRSIVKKLHSSLRDAAKGEGRAALHAVGLLGVIGDQADLPLIMAKLDSEDAAGRRHALAALAGFSSASVKSNLVEATRDADYRVRVAALRALGGVLASSSETAAVDAAKDGLDDEFPTVRIAAATALGSMGAASAVRDLLAALQRDRNLRVQVAVLEALTKIESPEARNVLQRFQTHSDLRLRRAAGAR